MPVSSRDLEQVIEVIADKKQLKVTVDRSVKGGIIAGVATGIGGLLLGPIGLAIGGAVGGTAAYATSGEFKPVSEVLRTLDHQQKEKLLEIVTNIIDKLEWYDSITLLRYLNGEGGWLRERIITAMIDCLKDELKMTIQH